MSNRADTFDRADGAIGTPSDGGSAWVVIAGAWNVISNRAGMSNLTSLACAVLESSVSNVEVQATIPVLGSTPRLVARLADANNFLLAYTNAGTTMQIYKRVAGTLTQLGSTYSGTVSAGDVLKFRVNGNDLIFYQNGVARVTTSDGAGASNTQHGIGSHQDTTCRFDDFSITEVVAAATGNPYYYYRQLAAA